MRFAVAIGTCLALLPAFLFAPFEHVHTGSGHAHHGSRAHSQPGVMHAHFYAARVVARVRSGIGIEADPDDHRNAWSVDLYALRHRPAPVLYLPQRRPLIVHAPKESIAPSAVVERRGHDPPERATAPPRAPPL
jgi:hypothetical protein